MEITLLDNKKTIANLVEVDTHESVLGFIEKELSKKEYNFVITIADIPKAKKIMADLNKSAKFIDTFRKDKVSVESVAIDLFKSNVKDYLALIDEKRDEIKKNVEVFEREAKDKILKELSLYCEEFVKLQNIREQFKEVEIIDLMVLGSVTSKGSLTKGAKESIEARVMVCKSKQDKYDFRLLNLENESRKAGLEAILTITHVQGIISLDSDAEYETRLNELISSEIERQNVVKANLQRQATETANREAHQEVLDGQSRIVSIFNGIAVDNGLSIDEKIDAVSNYDFKQFAQLEEFARAKSQSVVSELKNLKDSLEKAQKSCTVTVNDKEVPIVHETIPSTQNEKQEQVKEVAADRKIVRINAIFEVEVPSHVDSGAVLNKVRSRLSDCDINSDTLKSLEVI